MGKKRIIQKSKEELIQEREKVEERISKEITSAPLKKIKEGNIYISSSYNNTIITLADLKGAVLAWNSAGRTGFKGAKKATPYAASKVAEVVAQVAKKSGVTRVSILVKGVGPGRESAIRALAFQGLDITSIKDVTPIPHNGCRPPKARRV